MKREVKKRIGKCINCTNNKSKKDWFIKKTVQWNEIFVCNMCWYYNSKSIFTDFVEVKKQNLIFWQPIKIWKR